MFCPPLSTPPATASGDACSLMRAIFTRASPLCDPLRRVARRAIAWISHPDSAFGVPLVVSVHGSTKRFSVRRAYEPNFVWFVARSRALLRGACRTDSAFAAFVWASAACVVFVDDATHVLHALSITRRLEAPMRCPRQLLQIGQRRGSVSKRRSRRGWHAALRPAADASTRPTRHCVRAACVVVRCRAAEKDDDEARAHPYRRSRGLRDSTSSETSVSSPPMKSLARSRPFAGTRSCETRTRPP